jgi:hypothetical protein
LHQLRGKAQTSASGTGRKIEAVFGFSDNRQFESAETACEFKLLTILRKKK